MAVHLAFLSIFFFGYILYRIIKGSKAFNQALLRDGYYTTGTVIGHEKKWTKIGRTTERLEFAIVEYKDKDGKLTTGLVQNAASYIRMYDIGVILKLIIYQNKIYDKSMTL